MIKRKIIIHNYFVNVLVVIVLSAGLSLIGVLLSDVADMGNILRYVKSPVLFMLNTIPLTLLMLLIYHLTSRHWVAFSAGGGFFLIMQVVNRFKMELREEPFTPEDILLGAEAARVVKISELPFSTLVILSFAFLAAVSIILLVFVKPAKMPVILRATGAVISVVLFVFAFNSVYKDNTLYNSFKVRGNIYSRVNQFRSRGFLYSFLVRANNFKFIEPENYNKSEAQRLLCEYARLVDAGGSGTDANGSEMDSGRCETDKDGNGSDTNGNEAGTVGNESDNKPANKPAGNGSANGANTAPHIIAVMGEAFYDIDRIPGIEFNEGYNPLENYNRITSQSYTGRIITNVFGGGTANTEFAFLTGHSMSIMPELTSPYSSYIRKDTFSLARMLEDKGYSTIAFHPGDAWFYNRVNVYNFFGFDDIYFKKDMDLEFVTYNHGYISDTDTYKFLLDKFEAHISDKPGVPLFEFVVTIDNHGPYSKNDIGRPHILKRTESMDSETYNILNNYLDGIMRCDNALGYLTDSINEMEEPVVFMYFADHLPHLGENNRGYKALGFEVNQNGSLEAYLNQYSTPYFIYSNKAAKKLLQAANKLSLPCGAENADLNGADSQEGGAPTISVNYIGAELLRYTGQNGGAYFNFLSELEKKLPVITERFYKENGVFSEDLSDDSKQLLDQYKIMQYYLMMEKDAVSR